MSDSHIKVSIIIPVYNMEQYLRQCLDSIVNQTLDDIEIICVDDCSSDLSLSILDEYAQKDSRFVVLKQEFNQGQGAARNRGIELARGEYIGFVDPDDWIDVTMYEKLYNQAIQLNSDIVMCEFSRYNEDTKEYDPSKYIRCLDENNAVIYPKIPLKVNLSQELVNRMLLVSLHYSWNRIYKKSVIDKHNIRYSSYKCYEDVNFVFRALLTAEKISYTDEILYYYRKHSSSSLQTLNYKSNIFIEVAVSIKKYLLENDLYDELKHNYDYFTIRGAKIVCENASNIVHINVYRKIKKLISKNLRIKFKKSMYKFRRPLISIIIPIYNAEKYLEKCFNSVKEQTFGQIQVICVNDFSDDNSQAIIQKYLYDKRFKLVNLKKNRGPGYAKNKGLEKAKGDYIMFLDPDDWLEKNACEIAYNQITKNNNDYVVFGNNEYYENTNKFKINSYRMEPFVGLSDNPHLGYKDLGKDFWRTSFSWAHIYKKSFLEDNEICFTKNYLSEDVPFYAKLVSNTNDISVIDQPLYNYRVRNSSLSNNQKLWKEIFCTRKKAHEIIKSSEHNRELLDTFLIYVIPSYIFWFEKFSQLDENLSETIYDEIRKIFTYYKIEYKRNIKQIKKFIPYRKFRKIVKLNYRQYKFFNIQNIFSIKNIKNHKVLTVCWAKIKFKRNR